MFELSDHHLNGQQRTAVAHEGSPLLVVAGAGSGKTGVLAHRVAALLQRGVAPERICLLTFSRRAAHELLARAGRLSDAEAAGRVWGGTFHAVANRVLRLFGRRVGLDPGFSILDGADVVEVFGLVRHDLGFDHGSGGSRRRFPRAATLAAIYDRVANTGQSLTTVLDRSFPWCGADIEGIRAIFAAYTARKRDRQLLDYDDLLLCWRALGAVPGLLSGMFDHVLVDEYQDTNAVQADILAALCPDGVGLTAVGDDAQAIYGFRAATAANMADFPRRFAGTTVVRLEQNYRSTPPILAMANAVMAQADPETTLAKELWSTRPGRRRPLLRTCGDEEAEAEAVCEAVLAHRDDGVALQQQAVLFRASHHADLIELALARRNIPYVKYGGLRFLEAAHVKDLLGLLRVLDNPCDELAWFRVLRLLDGVGATTARRVMADLGLHDHKERATKPPVPDPVVTPLARFLAAPPRVPPSAREELAALRSALSDCAAGCVPERNAGCVPERNAGCVPERNAGCVPAAAQVARLRQWLNPVVERVYGAGPARLADLDHLEQLAGAAATRSRFVSDLTLDPPASTSDLAGPPHLDEDWLVLSTIHSAKGGEWEVVHVLHASDGMFPSDMATGDVEGIDEERRLLYVAITRARQVLEVNVPVRYHFSRHPRSDAHSYAQISRFLTTAVRHHMEEAHVEGRPGVDDGVDASCHEAGTDLGLASVDQLLAGLWA